MLDRFGISLLLVLSLVCQTAALADDRSATNLEALKLRDQYGIVRGLIGGDGGLGPTPPPVQIAIIVSAKRLRRIKPWEQAIRRIDEQVPLIRVADVPQTAPTEYESVAAKLEKRLPEDFPVLIDLDGVWSRTFQLDSSVPNLLIFDVRGAVVARHAGMYTRKLFEAFESDLLALHRTAEAAPAAEDPPGPQSP